MCIVNECDETVPLANDDPHMMVLLDGAKAELLQLARQQVSSSCHVLSTTNRGVPGQRDVLTPYVFSLTN